MQNLLFQDLRETFPLSSHFLNRTASLKYLLFSSSLISSLFKAPPCTLKLFLDDLQTKDLGSIINFCRGQFFLIIYKNSQYYFVTDKTASIPIYLYENNNKVDISNLFLPLAKNNSTNLNNQGLAEYLTMFSTYEKTLVKEINPLRSGCIYQYDNGSLSI